MTAPAAEHRTAETVQTADGEPTLDLTVAGVLGPGDAGRGSFLRPGERFGPWKLLEHLADGGFGSVWRAAAVEPVDTDRRTVRVDENAAIKFFAATTHDHRARIVREVTLAQRLGGQWTPEYYGADLDAIPQWAAFELVTDATLRDLVRSTGPLAGESLAVFAEDLWDALAFFRRNGVAHRDLTPANVHVHARTAKPRVIDWGNARDADSGTQTPYLPRTAGYAAPEQVEGRPAGPAADLWSWGAVVCFAATGHPPLPVDGYHHAVIACDVPLDLDGVPAPLLPALDAALRWDPADRDPDEIAAHLPGRRAQVELDVVRARQAALDQVLHDLRRRVRQRDEHIDALEGAIAEHESERQSVIRVRERLARAERERDEAARDVTALRARVAELENEREARGSRPGPPVDELRSAAERDVARLTERRRSVRAHTRALRRTQVVLGVEALRNETIRRALRAWRTRSRVASRAPLIGGSLALVGLVALAVVRAEWESRWLLAAAVVPAGGGLAVCHRLGAMGSRWRDRVKAAALGAMVVAASAVPLVWSIVPVPSAVARWVLHAPFPTPPPAEAVGVGHGARLVDVDPADCLDVVPANSFWDVVVVDC